MKSRFPKVRPRIQRAFIAWYQAHKKEWRRPLSLLSRKDDEMSFTLQGLNPNLCIYLHDWKFGNYRDAREFGISVNWQGQCWDVLMSYMILPARSHHGYYHRFTLPDDRQIYSSRETLWAAEMFEPLMNWLNNRFFSVKWLVLYQRCEQDGEVVKTWAAPLAEPDPKAIASILIWQD